MKRARTLRKMFLKRGGKTKHNQSVNQTNKKPKTNK